jgi:hypothetical protein
MEEAGGGRKELPAEERIPLEDVGASAENGELHQILRQYVLYREERAECGEIRQRFETWIGSVLAGHAKEGKINDLARLKYAEEAELKNLLGFEEGHEISGEVGDVGLRITPELLLEALSSCAGKNGLAEIAGVLRDYGLPGKAFKRAIRILMDSRSHELIRTVLGGDKIPPDTRTRLQKMLIRMEKNPDGWLFSTLRRVFGRRDETPSMPVVYPGERRASSGVRRKSRRRDDEYVPPEKREFTRPPTGSLNMRETLPPGPPSSKVQLKK